MSDFVLIASTPAACTSTAYGTLGLCAPLTTTGGVSHNCCVTKIVYPTGASPYYDLQTSNTMCIWDARSVTAATGYSENICGYNEVGGYGYHQSGRFYVNFGCTVELTISGLFPKRQRRSDDSLILVSAYYLLSGNHGAWSPTAPAPMTSNDDYICTSSSTYMEMFIRSASAASLTGCCYTAMNDCPDTGVPRGTPCTYYDCAYFDPVGDPSSAYATGGYECGLESRSYVWTYTCDVPCGVTVVAQKYDNYFDECRAGAYVDMTIQTTSSKCAI